MPDHLACAALFSQRNVASVRGLTLAGGAPLFAVAHPCAGGRPSRGQWGARYVLAALIGAGPMEPLVAPAKSLNLTPADSAQGHKMVA